MARTLLTVGSREWERLNREKRELLTPSPGTSVEEVLRRGQRLSAQAAALRRALNRDEQLASRS